MARQQDDDAHYLHHGSFVNHQLSDFLAASNDPETRKRNAAIVKQLSPPRSAADKQRMDPAHTTAYEKWWYEQRNKILEQLGEKSDETTSSNNANGGGNGRQQQQVQQSPSNYRVCDRCHGSIPRSSPSPASKAQQQQQQASPTANGGTPRVATPAAVSAPPPAGRNTSVGSTASGRSPSRSAVPGTDFEPLHPSHLYLHTHDLINHPFENAVQHPESQDVQRAIKQSMQRSPPRNDGYKGMSEYEKWWYSERDRVAKYMTEHQPK